MIDVSTQLQFEPVAQRVFSDFKSYFKDLIRTYLGSTERTAPISIGQLQQAIGWAICEMNEDERSEPDVSAYERTLSEFRSGQTISVSEFRHELRSAAGNVI